MKITKLLPILVVLALLSITSCATDSMDEDVVNSIEIPTPPDAKEIEIEIMELINAYRINEGLSLLEQHTTVKAVASTHTDYMIEVNNVSHDNFFLRKQSLEENASANHVSENVAYGFNSAESVVNAWIASPSHLENIVGDFTHFDVSAEQNSNGKWYFTNMFINK
ncbi:CAP domain-containing protein [Winogradskyella undariae]|uniref:CAP domain-containing protein n=1 Tax=Winogradskyella TaxID=286104 RepID=UPI00156B494F|nr:MULTISPECIES: CAP domain-containing protein [Winogradskyella]NRR90769.1 CAP domain-containing protein [Winogradskyella undariae]QXP79458.1 CAP domain-containing protein [Winogradskyella sp. HaHa_3_26]